MRLYSVSPHLGHMLGEYFAITNILSDQNFINPLRIVSAIHVKLWTIEGVRHVDQMQDQIYLVWLDNLILYSHMLHDSNTAWKSVSFVLSNRYRYQPKGKAESFLTLPFDSSITSSYRLSILRSYSAPLQLIFFGLVFVSNLAFRIHDYLVVFSV